MIYLENSLNELKNFIEKINENKENLKLKIQKIFTKIRNTLNEREDQILLEVDNQFNKIYFNEDIIKKSEKLPNKIKFSLERGRKIEKEWNENNAIFLVNDCINIENNIKEINIIKNNIKKANSLNADNINFYPNEYENNIFLDSIKTFGKIVLSEIKYKFRKCPENIKENKKYIITGENENIVTVIGRGDEWIGILCQNELKKTMEHKWKIKIIKTKNKNIMVGIAPVDFNINTCYWKTGYYLVCHNSTLYSGPPFNNNGKVTNLEIVKKEITLIMDINKGSLKIIMDNDLKEEIIYLNIPIDKPITPAVLLYDKDDTIEIVEC